LTLEARCGVVAAARAMGAPIEGWIGALASCPTAVAANATAELAHHRQDLPGVGRPRRDGRQLRLLN
jgi:hypothetical protein